MKKTTAIFVLVTKPENIYVGAFSKELDAIEDAKHRTVIFSHSENPYEWGRFYEIWPSHLIK